MKRAMIIVLVPATALSFVLIFMICVPTQATVWSQDQVSIIVNTLDDEDNGDGDCSLREAIKAAGINAAVDFCPAGGTLTDTITFSVEGLIVLANQLLILPGDPLVISAGDAITLDGMGSVRILTVFKGADLTLEDISLINGYSTDWGGAIYNSGSLSIIDCYLSGNQVVGGSGGAIYNAGILSIEGTTFSYNGSSSMQYPDGTQDGGAVYNDRSTMTVSNSEFLYNTARLGGGIAINYGALSITGSLIRGNLSGAGGGIFNFYSDLTVTNSIISSNMLVPVDEEGSGSGGGIMNWGGSAVISNTTILANHTYRSGGGIHTSDGLLELYNSTLSENSSDGVGGGISSSGYWSSPTISYSTFYSNTTIEEGGSIYLEGLGSTFNIVNSIIAGSPAACGCESDDKPCSTKFIDLGHNIESTNTCFFQVANSSMPDTDPQLMPLEDNGGPNLTHALMTGSPAIDEIDPAGCIATDQRWVARPIDGDVDGNAWCDIGSYEYQLATTTTITGDDPDPSKEGEPFTVAFEVESSYGMPTGEVLVTVSGSEEDCTGTLSDGDGSCMLILNEAGNYTLTATYLGAGELGRSSDETGHIVESSMVDFYLPVIFK